MRTITLQKEWIIGQMYNIYLYIATFIKDLLSLVNKNGHHKVNGKTAEWSILLLYNKLLVSGKQL